MGGVAATIGGFFAGTAISHLSRGIAGRNNDNNLQEELRNAYNMKLEELAQKEKLILNKENEYQTQIKELEKKIQNQIDEHRQMMMKKEKEELENKKKEQEKRRKEIQEKKQAYIILSI